MTTYLSDPIILLELVTLLFTMGYLALLMTFLREDNKHRHETPLLFQSALCSFFDVGNLISAPKRSLRNQHI